MDIVSPLKQLGKYTVGAAWDTVSNYTDNVSTLASDAREIRDNVMHAGKTSVEIFNDFRMNGMKKFNDWFWQGEGDFAEYDLGNADEDFDAGFQIDNGNYGEEETESSQILDARSMKDITRGQVSAMYKIGGKQVEAATMNTAEIVKTMNERSSEIVASVNSVNTTLTKISKQLDVLGSKMYDSDKDDYKNRGMRDGITDSEGKLTIGNVVKATLKELSQYTDMFGMAKDMVGMMGPRDLIGMGFEYLAEHKIDKLGGKSVSDFIEGFDKFVGAKMDEYFSALLDTDFVKNNTSIGSKSWRKDYSSLAPNHYNTDLAKFDGITRQTIVEIIPGYLKSINTALTGQNLEINAKGHLTTGHVDTWSDITSIAMRSSGMESDTYYKISGRIKTLNTNYSSTDVRTAGRTLVTYYVFNVVMDNDLGYLSNKIIRENMSDAIDTCSQSLAQYDKSRTYEQWREILIDVAQQIFYDEQGSAIRTFAENVIKQCNSMHNTAGNRVPGMTCPQDIKPLTFDLAMETFGRNREYQIKSDALYDKYQEDKKANETALENTKHIVTNPEYMKLLRKNKDIEEKYKKAMEELENEHDNANNSFTAQPVTFKNQQDVYDKLGSIETYSRSIWAVLNRGINVRVLGGKDKGFDHMKLVRSTVVTPTPVTIGYDMTEPNSTPPSPVKSTALIASRKKNKGSHQASTPEGSGTSVHSDEDGDSDGDGDIPDEQQNVSSSTNTKTTVQGILNDINKNIINTINKVIDNTPLKNNKFVQEHRPSMPDPTNMDVDGSDKSYFDLVRTAISAALSNGNGVEDLNDINTMINKIKNPTVRANVKRYAEKMIRMNSKKADAENEKQTDPNLPPEKKPGILGGIAQLFMGKAKTIFSPILTLLTPITSLVKVIARPLINLAKKGFKSGANDIKAGAKQIWDNIKPKFLVNKKSKDAIYNLSIDENGEYSLNAEESKKDSKKETKTTADAGALAGIKQPTNDQGLTNPLAPKGTVYVVPQMNNAYGTTTAAATWSANQVFQMDATKNGVVNQPAPVVTATNSGWSGGQEIKLNDQNIKPDNTHSIYTTGKTIPTEGAATGAGTGKDSKLMGILKGIGSVGQGLLKIALTLIASLTAVKAAMDLVIRVIKRSIQPLNKGIKRLMNSIKPVIKSLGNLVKQLANFVTKIVDTLMGIIQPLMDILTPVIDAIMVALEPLLASIDKIVQVAVDIVEPLMPVVQLVLDNVTTTLTMLTKLIDEIVTPFTEAIQPIIEELGEQFTPFITELMDTVAPIRDMISTTAIEILAPLYGNFVNDLLPAIQDIAALTKLVFGAVELHIGGVETGIGTLVAGIGKIMSMLTDDKFADKMVESGQRMQQAGENTTKAGLQNIGSALLYMAERVGLIEKRATEKKDDVEVPEPINTNSNITFHGSVMDGITGSGDPHDQHSYGSFLNMEDHGCGPIALADSIARRNGGVVNAANLALSMVGSGAYDINNGTSIAGFMDTAASMGLSTQLGGVTASSLSMASPDNPITIIGSGYGFGTRNGNNHYLNVLGTNSSGGAYVSNPLTGRIEVHSASGLANNALAGIYGSGDALTAIGSAVLPGPLNSALQTMENAFDFAGNVTDNLKGQLGSNNTKSDGTKANDSKSDKTTTTTTSESTDTKPTGSNTTNNTTNTGSIIGDTNDQIQNLRDATSALTEIGSTTGNTTSIELGSVVEDAFADLKEITSKLLGIFNFDGTFETQVKSAVGKTEDEAIIKQLKSNTTEAEYEEYEKQARALFEKENPKKFLESDKKYEQRFQKNLATYLSRVSADDVASKQIDLLNYGYQAQINNVEDLFGKYDAESDAFIDEDHGSIVSTISDVVNSSVGTGILEAILNKAKSAINGATSLGIGGLAGAIGGQIINGQIDKTLDDMGSNGSDDSSTTTTSPNNGVNDPNNAGSMVSSGGVKLGGANYTPTITQANVTKADDTSSMTPTPIHEFFAKMAGESYAWSNNGNWYSRRQNPDTSGKGSSGQTHSGVDIKTPNRTTETVKIYATTDGTVTDTRGGVTGVDHTNHTAGNAVYWKDDAGYLHRIMHLANTTPLVKAGDRIYGGQTLLGYMGNTGDSTGHHTHYDISSGGTNVNPMTYFQYATGTTQSNSSYSSNSKSNGTASNIWEAQANAANAKNGKIYNNNTNSTTNTTSNKNAKTKTNTTNIKFNYNTLGQGGGSTADYVWNYLVNTMGLTPQGAAGVMGNLRAESNIIPNNLEDSYESILGYTDESYTDAVDSGAYPRSKFISDHKKANCGAGYGLPQFTWYTLKGSLYDNAKSQGKSISDVGVQMETVFQTTGQSLYNLLKSTTDIKTASDRWLYDYENPSNASSQSATRYKYAKAIYDQYANGTTYMDNAYDSLYGDLTDYCNCVTMEYNLNNAQSLNTGYSGNTTKSSSGGSSSSGKTSSSATSTTTTTETSSPTFTIPDEIMAAYNSARTQGKITLNGASANSSGSGLWNSMLNTFGDEKIKNFFDTAADAGLTPAEQAFFAAIGVVEDSGKKVFGDKSLSKTTYDKYGQAAFGIMNWKPSDKANPDTYGYTLSDQLKTIYKLYLSDNPAHSRATIQSDIYNKYVKAMEEAMGTTSQLGPGQHWGDIIDTNILEAMGHFVANALVPEGSNTTNIQAKHMQLVADIYNWMIDNGMISVDNNSNELYSAYPNMMTYYDTIISGSSNTDSELDLFRTVRDMMSYTGLATGSTKNGTFDYTKQVQELSSILPEDSTKNGWYGNQQYKIYYKNGKIVKTATRDTHGAWDETSTPVVSDDSTKTQKTATSSSMTLNPIKTNPVRNSSTLTEDTSKMAKIVNTSKTTKLQNLDNASAAEQIFYYLTEKAGFSKAGALGALANIGYESAANKQNLYDTMVEMGSTIDDPNVQMAALMKYLNQYHPGLVEYLKTTDDPTTAARRWMKEYENPSVLAWNTRTWYLNKYGDLFENWDPSVYNVSTADMSEDMKITQAYPNMVEYYDYYYNGLDDNGNTYSDTFRTVRDMMSYVGIANNNYTTNDGFNYVEEVQKLAGLLPADKNSNGWYGNQQYMLRYNNGTIVETATRDKNGSWVSVDVSNGATTPKLASSATSYDIDNAIAYAKALYGLDKSEDTTIVNPITAGLSEDSIHPTGATKQSTTTTPHTDVYYFWKNLADGLSGKSSVTTVKPNTTKQSKSSNSSSFFNWIVEGLNTNTGKVGVVRTDSKTNSKSGIDTSNMKLSVLDAVKALKAKSSADKTTTSGSTTPTASDFGVFSTDNNLRNSRIANYQNAKNKTNTSSVIASDLWNPSGVTSSDSSKSVQEITSITSNLGSSQDYTNYYKNGASWSDNSGSSSSSSGKGRRGGSSYDSSSIVSVYEGGSSDQASKQYQETKQKQNNKKSSTTYKSSVTASNNAKTTNAKASKATTASSAASIAYQNTIKKKKTGKGDPDITPSTITNVDIPDIDLNKLLGNDSTTSTPKITYTSSTQYTTSKNSALNQILNNTFNVRAKRVEELLESIDKKLDSYNKKPNNPTPTSTTNPSDKFPNNGVPTQIDRLALG